MVGMWLFRAWALLQLVLCGAMDELPFECACCFGEVGVESSVCYSHRVRMRTIMIVLRRFKLLDLDFLIAQGIEKSLLDVLKFDHALF